MDIAYLSTLSALAGSVVGGLTSGVATWLSQRVQARETQLAREMSRRDTPLQGFHWCGIESLWRSHYEQEPNVQELVALLCHDQQDVRPVLAANRRGAENIMRATIDAYFAPGKTIREFHELVQSGTGIDLLKELQRGRSRKVAGIHRVIGLSQKALYDSRRAQFFVNGFLSELLTGLELAIRIMSMRARNVAGTRRCPG